MLGRVVVFGVLALAVGWSEGAEAQRFRDRPLEPRLYLDLDLMGADPVGEFEEMVGAGFGGQVGLRVRVGPRNPLFLRVDGGLMVYGHESFDVCFPSPIGCRIGADLTTTNTVAYMGVGPEFAASGPVAPYIYGTVGFSYFSTQSSLSDYDGGEDHFNTRHFSDLVTGSRLGGGLRFRFGGVRSVLMDVGAEYHRNGIAEYLREGDILDNPDGSVTVFPNRTEANFVTFRLGVSIPLGGGDHDDEDWNHRGHR